jgi:hypothetical protein
MDLTPKLMALEHVYGALVELCRELTKLAANANRAIDEEREATRVKR